MVRIRHSDSVKIQISGPRKIIPHTRVEIGRRSITWKQFVVDVCGIKLDRKKDYFICTAGYSPNHSVEGWTANLNDKIELFVTNYTKKLKKYSVRLHRGRAPQTTGGHSQTPPESQPEAQPEIGSPNNNCSQMYESPRKPILSLAAKKFATISPLKPSQLEELIVQQNIKENTLESRSLSNETAGIPPRRGIRKRNKKRTWTESVRVSEAKQVIRKGSSSRCKNSPRPPKLVRYDNVDMNNGKESSSNLGISEMAGNSKKLLKFDMTDDVDEVNGECTINGSFSVKQELEEIVIIDLLELEEEDQDNGESIEKCSLIGETISEGKYQFNKLISTGKYENAGEVINEERNQSGPEMKDLLTRFEQCVDTFDEDLLEQIKLEVVSLKKNGAWNKNMKRSPLACYLIEEICRA